MIHGNANISIFFTCSPMNCADLLSTEELRHGVATQRDDDLWLQRSYLSVKIVIAGTNFFGKGVAIIGWAALDDVCDKHVCSFQIDTLEQFIQELSCGANERTSLFVFVKAWTFTDKQYPCAWIPFTRNGFCTASTEITL